MKSNDIWTRIVFESQLEAKLSSRNLQPGHDSKDHYNEAV